LKSADFPASENGTKMALFGQKWRIFEKKGGYFSKMAQKLLKF